MTLIAALLLSISGGHAQELATASDGVTIYGSVLDAHGNPVIGATVKLEGDGGVAESVTDASGVYEFAALQVGNYTLDATKSGLRSPVATVAALAKGVKEKVDLTLADEGSIPSRANGPAKLSAQGMEYSDEPNFSVAGVTDWTAVGGHGSDSSLRTSEALSRETLRLKPEESARAATGDANQRNADMHREAGEVDETRGDPLSAVNEFEEAVHLDPSETNYFEWGSELLLHRAIWQAQEVFEKGVREYPRSARVMTGLGAALFAGARYDEAAQRLCDASDLNPKDPEPYIFMGKIQVAAPDPLTCIEKRLARFAEEQPENSLANYLYAMAVLKNEGSPADPHAIKQAKMLLTKAVTIDTKCGDAYLQLGILAASDHNPGAAIDFYKKAIAANPQFGEAHYRLGIAYDRVGQPAKAKAEFALHDQIEKEQAEEVERQRRGIKQFLISAPGQTNDMPPK
ncbi:MAG: tetratricopeptide repeat protein [Terracidiphilus sp.]